MRSCESDTPRAGPAASAVWSENSHGDMTVQPKVAWASKPVREFNDDGGPGDNPPSSILNPTTTCPPADCRRTSPAATEAGRLCRLAAGPLPGPSRDEL